MFKKTFCIFIIVLALCAWMAVSVDPAVGANNITSSTTLGVGWSILNFSFTGDSAAIDTSASFSMGQYDHESWYSYPFTYNITRAFNDCDTVDTANVRIVIDRSMDGSTWTLIDTLYSFADSTVTDAAAWGTIDFMNKKAPYYRLRALELAKEGADSGAVWDIKLLRYQGM